MLRQRLISITKIATILSSGLLYISSTSVAYNNMGMFKANDPCVGKAIGVACAGTSALYAGVYNGAKYMIMPSGCADSTSNPACAGNDTVTKTWNNATTNWYDFTTLPNLANATVIDTNSGATNTTNIIADTTHSANPYVAAQYCSDMTYGGYTDWFLPSKSEFAYIYCKSFAASHSASNPQENVNCGGTTPTGQLTGFVVFPNYYWTSSESMFGSMAYYQAFGNGYQYNGNKNLSYYVRCIRKYN